MSIEFTRLMILPGSLLSTFFSGLYGVQYNDHNGFSALVGLHVIRLGLMMREFPRRSGYDLKEAITMYTIARF